MFVVFCLNNVEKNMFTYHHVHVPHPLSIPNRFGPKQDRRPLDLHRAADRPFVPFVPVTARQQVYRHSKELLPSLPWPQLACQRLVAWSDLHIDMGENMRHLEGMAGDQERFLAV